MMTSVMNPPGMRSRSTLFMVNTAVLKRVVEAREFVCDLFEVGVDITQRQVSAQQKHHKAH